MFQLLFFYSFFTVLCHIAVFLEWSFKIVAYASFIPVFCTIFLHFLLRGKNIYVEEKNYHSEVNTSNEGNVFLVIAVILCLVISLFSIRSETDEAFYSSVETHAIENIDLPLLKYDGMFGESDIAILHSSYKVQSYQILSAVISYWTTIPPPLVRHVFFSLVATILFLIVWVKLFKLFIPHKWQLGLFILTILIVFLGGYYSITEFSIVRFYDGKCVLVNVIIPLLYYYSILFFRKQSYVGWFNLVNLQIVGLGLSSSAISLLPLQILIIGLIYWKANYDRIRSCVIFGASSSYLVIIGIIIKVIMNADDVDGVAVISEQLISESSFKTTFLTLLGVYGGTISAKIITIVAMFGAWVFLPRGGDLRRVVLFVPLIMVFIVFNPLFVESFSFIISKMIYWRLAYIMPIPLFIVIMTVGIMQKAELYFKKEWDMVFMKILALFFLIYPYLIFYHPFKSENYSWNIKYYFSPRFDPKLYEIAKIIRGNTSVNTRALVPAEISQWLAAMPSAPKLIAVNIAHRPSEGYLLIMRNSFGIDETDMRINLHKIISGKVKDFDANLFSDWLIKMNVGSISFKDDLPYSNKLSILLDKGGYKKLDISEKYMFWVK